MYDGVASLSTAFAAVHSQPSPEPEGLHVLAKTPAPRRRLRIVVLNGSAPLLKTLCQWLEQHGHHCDTALVADVPRAHEEVGWFIRKHRPDVVIYDVGMHYASSWDLLEAIRMSTALQSQPFVITTPDKGKLEHAVGATPAIEMGGRDTDLRLSLIHI